LPEPRWADYFATHLDGAAGYVFAVARNGQLVAEGSSGLARTAADPPSTSWAFPTRMHLASVSKPVTAVAMLAMLSAKGLSVNDLFYPLIKSRCPQAGPGVNTVTIANLLTMKSGMVVDGTLNVTDLWAFLSQYLQQGLVGTPGVTEAYSNTNFTILQAIIAILADPGNNGGNGIDPYVNYVSNNVLTPMGIDTNDFNAVPDPANTSTLTYSANDSRQGQYWGALDCVGPGGWVSSARALLKFAIGIRNNSVLKAETTNSMFLNGYGWYTYDGIYGQYFHHNGGLLNGATPPQGLVTGVIHLADGYDAVILVNSWGFDTIALMVDAFEQRG
jgi:CubicO group peptidase (beta-lactamase class C family)